MTVPLLEEEGFSVSTKRIADAAGIAEGTVFRVFSTKEELLRAAVASYMDPSDLIEEIDAIDPALPLEQKMSEVMSIVQESAFRVRTFMAAMKGQRLRESAGLRAQMNSDTDMEGRTRPGATFWNGMGLRFGRGDAPVGRGHARIGSDRTRIGSDRSRTGPDRSRTGSDRDRIGSDAPGYADTAGFAGTAGYDDSVGYDDAAGYADAAGYDGWDSDMPGSGDPFHPYPQFMAWSSALLNAIERTLQVNESEIVVDLPTASAYIMTIGLASLIMRTALAPSNSDATIALTLRALTKDCDLGASKEDRR